jgi:hypothetical protein
VSAQALLEDLPRLHDFGRAPEVGGLDKRIGEGGISVDCLEFLREQDEFEYVGLDGKFATFRKVLDRPILFEWDTQPFIVRNTSSPPSQ